MTNKKTGIILAALGIGSLAIVTGIATTTDTPTTTPTALFTAQFAQDNQTYWDALPIDITTQITNREPLATGDVVGLGGTHQVCLFLNDKIPQIESEGRPLCQMVSLAYNESKPVQWRLPALSPGVYEVRVLDAVAVVEVREAPAFGELIRGEHADIRLVEGRETENTAWRWTFEVAFHNETPIDLRVDFGMGMRAIQWDGTETTVTFESTAIRPRANWPVQLFVEIDGYRSATPQFAWCCAD